MNKTLSQKPFLDYTSQLNILKKKNLIINNDQSAIYILSKISYYSLINGYKDSFKDFSTHDFLPNTQFHDIYNLYLLDADLREIFLKYILIFEQNIKSSISYHFTELYGNGILYYQNPINYDYGKNLSSLNYLFHKMNQKINLKNPSSQISHYMNIYHDVPLWVLTTNLTIGEISTMYRYLKGHCKTLVCNDFHNIGKANLGKILIMLTKYRNICAHGNRLFNVQTGDHILDCDIHKKLHLTKTGNLYDCGKSDLFAAVICLKYVLDPADFHSFYYELKKTIKKYQPSDSILKTMGFPCNWMSILRIKVY